MVTRNLAVPNPFAKAQNNVPNSTRQDTREAVRAGINLKVVPDTNKGFENEKDFSNLGSLNWLWS